MIISFIRTIILYITVIIAMRVMGKRQIGELQPSELVVTIMISELASIPMQSTGIPIFAGVVPILTLMVAEVSLSFLSMKSKAARKILVGTPSVIIKNGKIDTAEMEKLRINDDDLMEELRLCSCNNITDVEYGIVETNGKLSVILKRERQPYTPSDAKKQTNQKQRRNFI